MRTCCLPAAPFIFFPAPFFLDLLRPLAFGQDALSLRFQPSHPRPSCRKISPPMARIPFFSPALFLARSAALTSFRIESGKSRDRLARPPLLSPLTFPEIPLMLYDVFLELALVFYGDFDPLFSTIQRPQQIFPVLSRRRSQDTPGPPFSLFIPSLFPNFPVPRGLLNRPSPATAPNYSELFF